MRYTSATKRLRLTSGFTLIEMLVIAPIVVLVISGFVALMITMVGDTLVTREQNNMSFETQDALDRIEQDTRLTTQFLATTNNLVAPQGSDSNFTGTAPFTSSNALILGGLTTDKNPSDTSRQLVYYANQPNDCGTLQSYNRVFQAKIIYFIKGGSLWRRAVVPDYNTNATVDESTVCSAPWQRNTCSPGYATGNRCATNDTELMKNVGAFSVKYLSSPGSTVDLGSANALAANAIEVSLSGSKTTLGRSVSSSGTMRATKLNSIDVDLPVPGVPNVTSQAASPSAIFSWDAVPNATSYNISYNINGGSWTNATTDNRTRTYTVTANLGDTVTIRVSAKNSTGTSDYDEAAQTIPYWNSCTLQNNWVDYGTSPYATNGYTKTNAGIVMLKGMIKNGTATSGTTLCTLPVGYRPAYQLAFETSSYTGSVSGPSRIEVFTNGDVKLIRGTNTWVALDGIRFPDSTSNYSWTALTPFMNSWAYNGLPYSPLQSTLDTMGRVHIQGVVKSGVYTNPTPIAPLVTGHKPALFTHIPATSGATFNYAGISGTYVDAMGINPVSDYSIQAMFYPAAYAGWNNLTLVSGWIAFNATSYSTPQYTKSADGVVTVKGLIKSGTVTDGTTIATLPVGYRPTEELVTTCAGNGAYCRIDIMPDGRILARTVNVNWTSLDNISFVADQ